MQPDPTTILETLMITEPLIGFYDAPDPAAFAPLVEPAGPRECIFASYPRWREGKTLHVTKDRHGCGAPQVLGSQVPGRSREEMVKFLADEEGLRASHELMELWLDATSGYEPRYDHILIGPLRADQDEFLRTITFYVNADQLSVLATGATYYSRPTDVPPVIAPFGSGCGQLAAAFPNLDATQAVIGATDQAMRKNLAPSLLAFTVTKPMFAALCRWANDPGSSLHNSFLAEVLEARQGSF
jgi:hypothetical protein